MAFRIKRKEKIGKAVRRIAGEQIDKAIGEIEDDQLDRHETVHQVRKRCKKIRGLVRLVRPSFEDVYDRENAWYRDAARTLSYIRDAQSIIETYDALVQRFQDEIAADTFDSIRKTLVERRQKVAEDEVGIDERLDQFLKRMQLGRERVDAWKLDDDEFDTVAAGLAKTYRRARKAMDRAYDEPTSENFHQWRKRVKYHWYHARILRSLWEPVVGAHRDAADELADMLGDEHDLAVLGETLVSEPADFGDCSAVETFLALVDRRRLELRADAHSLGRRLLAEKPKHLCRRLACYWKIWRARSKTQHVQLDALLAVTA